MDAMKTGELIAQARKEQGLTQRELAQRLFVSVQAVSKWEKGKNFPDLALMEPLAEALELTVSELVAGQRGEAPGEELVRDSLRFGLAQLGPKIRRWRWLFLLTAALLAGLMLRQGYVWVRDSTELLPQRTTVVRPLPWNSREATMAHAAGKTWGGLYYVDFADDAERCSFRWELWTHQGLENSWEAGEWKRDSRRHQLLAVTFSGAYQSPELEYGIALESYPGTVQTGLDGVLEVPYLGDSYGIASITRRTAADPEEGVILLLLSLSRDGRMKMIDAVEHLDGRIDLPPESETAVYLLLRMNCLPCAPGQTVGDRGSGRVPQSADGL